MAIVITKVPAENVTYQEFTLKELLSILPKKIKYSNHVWLSNHMARYGRQAGNLIFLVNTEGEPSSEMMEYFDSLVRPLGINATCSERYLDPLTPALMIYGNGELLIDPVTLSYTRAPEPIRVKAIVTYSELVQVLPKEVEFKEDVYLTGSIARFGWSANDVDFISQNTDKERLLQIKKELKKYISWRVDVGAEVMPHREPVYLLLAYSGGKCLL